jgi:hypothetical protein
MSFPPNTDFDKFIQKSSDVKTNKPVKEQFIQIIKEDNTTCFETFVNSYLYRIVDNKYELLGDKKIVIEETDEILVTNKNGKVVRVVKDPIGSREEQQAIEVIVDGEKITRVFSTLYYTYFNSFTKEVLCSSLIDITKEFYINRDLPSVFTFTPNVDKIFSNQLLDIPFNGDNKWYGVTRTRNTTRPDIIIQIGTDGTVLEVHTCPLPSEKDTDITRICIPLPETVIFFEDFEDQPLGTYRENTGTGNHI